MKRIVFLDFETSGLSAERHEILSGAMVLWSTQEILQWYRTVYHQELCITQKAHELNQLNPFAGEVDLDQFILEMNLTLQEWGFKTHEPIIFGGHNVQFDLKFLRAAMKKTGYSDLFKIGHSTVDTQTIAHLLQTEGLIPMGTTSLDQIMPSRYAHQALNDAYRSLELWRMACTLTRKDKENVAEPYNYL